MKLAASLLAALLLAVGAPLALAGSKPKPKPLPVGKFKIDNSHGGFYSVDGGSFKVIRKKKVVAMSVIPAAGNSNPACGTKPVGVKGKLPITIARRGGYASWIVGKNTPTKGDGVSPIKATTFLVNGQPVQGTAKMVFNYENPKAGDADFEMPNCQLMFVFRKAK